MNKMYSLARIVLIGLGLFIIIRLCTNLYVWVVLVLSQNQLVEWDATFIYIIGLLICLTILAAAIYLIRYKVDGLAKKMVGVEDLPQPQGQAYWLPLAFRLVCVAAGLYFLYAFTTELVWFLHGIARQMTLKINQNQLFTGQNYRSWNQIFSSGVKLTAGIYLVCGAPHFVRWHVKKTLEQCGRGSEEAVGQ